MNNTERQPEEGPLKNPDWTDEENLLWDSWVNGGVKTEGQATADIEKARAERAQRYNLKPVTEPPARGSDEDIHIPPDPPQTRESEEDFSWHHLEELTKSGFGDPEKLAELERRVAEGDARLKAAMEEEIREGQERIIRIQRLHEKAPAPEEKQQ